MKRSNTRDIQNNLNLTNGLDLLSLTGEEPVAEWVMEKVMEELETQCYNNMQNIMKTVEGLGIEYDETVTCDVCKSVRRNCKKIIKDV